MAGRPPDVTDEEILCVFQESDDPVLFTGDVADELPIGHNGTRMRLTELEEEGHLKKKQRGKAIVCWLAEENGQ